MYEFMIEAILIAIIAVPLIAGTKEPVRATSNWRMCLPRKLRRDL